MRKPLIAWAGTGAVEVTECCCASSSKQQSRGRAFLLFPLGWSAEVRRLMPPSARNSAALMCSCCEPPHLFPDIRLPPDERRNSRKRMVVWMRNERAVSWRQKKRCGECLAAHPRFGSDSQDTMKGPDADSQGAFRAETVQSRSQQWDVFVFWCLTAPL